MSLNTMCTPKVFSEIKSLKKEPRFSKISKFKEKNLCHRILSIKLQDYSLQLFFKKYCDIGAFL